MKFNVNYISIKLGVVGKSSFWEYSQKKSCSSSWKTPPTWHPSTLRHVLCQRFTFFSIIKNIKTWLTNFLPPRNYSILSSEHVIQDVLKYLTFCILSWKHEWCNLFCLKQIYALIEFILGKKTWKFFIGKLTWSYSWTVFLCCVCEIFLDKLTENWGGEKWLLGGKVKSVMFQHHLL